MKKLLSILLTLTLLLVPCTVFADQDGDVRVTVSICASAGDVPLALAEIVVTDVDSDGALTINDALYLAHEQYYEGGAAAGYASAQTQYGLSLVTLWGMENGVFGYYLNDASAMSLADEVKNGDRVYAYAYTDTEGYSDLYCFFDGVTPEAKAGEEITLTLLCAAYDENWSPVQLPMAGLTLTVNGEKIEATSGEDGTVRFTLPEAGSYLISAVSQTAVIVPPLCRIEVSAAASSSTPATSSSIPASVSASVSASASASGSASASASASVSASASASASASQTANKAPVTGDFALWMAVVALAAFASVTVVAVRKNEN